MALEVADQVAKEVELETRVGKNSRFASGLIMLCGESQYSDQESDPEKMYSGKDRLDSLCPAKRVLNRN